MVVSVKENQYEVREMTENFVIILDRENGDLITIPKIDLEKNVVKSKQHIEAIKRYYENLQLRMRDSRGDFYRVPSETNRKLVLSLTDRAFIIFLSLFVDYEKRLHKDGKPLRNADIAELWKVYNKNGQKESITLKKTSERLSRLVASGVLVRLNDEEDGRHSNYIFNKDFLFQGASNKKDEKFVKVYQKKLKEVILELKKIEKRRNQNRKKTKVDIVPIIGLLHAIIPYVHYQTAYLVKKPDFDLNIRENETLHQAIIRNAKNHIKLPTSIISKSLGYTQMNRKTLENYFEILADAGAIKISTTYGNKLIRVHPDLMYRQDAHSKSILQDLRSEFEFHCLQE